MGSSTGGDFRLAQTVSSANVGSSCPADSGCTTSVPIASLLVANTADVTTTQPTGVVNFDVTFTNTGQVPYVGIVLADQFADALDDSGYNGDAAATSGSVSLNPATAVLTWTGDLPVGASVSVTGSGTVYNPDPGDGNVNTVVTTTAPGSNCPVGGSDPACVTNVQVLTPELTITKTADKTAAAPADTITHTITVHNTGQVAYTGARVSDALVGVLDDAAYTGGSATSGTLTFSEPLLSWVGDLALDQTAVITYRVQVDVPDFGDKTMADTVVSDEIGSSCPTGGARASCSTVVTVLIPGIALSVVADRTTTTPGATVGYTVTISNTGQTDAPGASVLVQLDGALDDAGYDGNAIATVGTVSFATPGLTWTGDLPVGATAVVTYTVTVADPASGDLVLATSLQSQVPGSDCSTGDGGGGPGGPGEAPPQGTSCTSSVSVLIPGLAVSTTADTVSATPGDRVRFTITVSNTGQAPYVGTVVSASLADVLDDASFDGAVTATTGVARYEAPQVTWTGSLPVGESAVITYTVRVKAPDSGNRVLSSTAIAPASGSTCQGDSTSPACTATVTVLIPRLTISQSASSPTTTPGGTVGYRITIVNDGETPYSGATVVSSLQDLVVDADYNGDAALVGGGLLSYRAPSLSWTGDLPVGASATITYSITVHDPATGDKHLTTSVSSTAAGSSCPPGATLEPCVTTVQVLVPELTMSKTADRSTVVAGSAVRYTVTLTNTGETDYVPATFSDSLAGVLDDATYAGGAVASSGTLEYADGTLAWSGPLAVGETATVSYSVTATFPASGDQTLLNRAVSNSPGASCDGGADAPCSTSVAVLVPELTVDKTVDTARVVAGGTVVYTITATNTGQADYPEASFSDALEEVLDGAAYNADATASTGAVSYDEGNLTWVGPLSRGATVVLTFSVTVNRDVTGDHSLDNWVVSKSLGSTCPPEGTDPACVATTEVEASFIGLVGLTPAFTLVGAPGSVVTQEGAVNMTVITNSYGGYSVTARAETDRLVGQTPGNADTIPVERLGVRPSGGSLFTPLSADSPLVVHQQDRASAAAGDAVSNDYQVDIPFVGADTYTTTVEYIVTAQ